MPKRIFDRWNGVISLFWWKGGKEGRYIAWVDRRKMQMGKYEGGLGFKKFLLVNLALLVKQAWRILNKPELLLTKVYKARYFSRTSLLEAEMGSRPSWGWRSIHKGVQMLRKWLEEEVTDQGSMNILKDEGIAEIKTVHVEALSQCCACGCELTSQGMRSEFAVCYLWIQGREHSTLALGMLVGSGVLEGTVKRPEIFGDGIQITGGLYMVLPT
ncbi:hypothetical protein QQ045_011283 [Rhodiola kirilowii]